MVTNAKLSVELLRQLGFDAGEEVWGIYHYKLYAVNELINFNNFEIDHRPQYGEIPERFQYSGKTLNCDIETFADLLQAMAQDYMQRGAREQLAEIKKYALMLFKDV